MNRLERYITACFLLLAIFVLDQGHKWYMLEIIDIDARGSMVITPFFNLVMVWNKGITFGLFQHLEQSPNIFSGIAVLIVLSLLAWVWFLPSTLGSIAIGLICGGALGNVFDRYNYGAVADFFDFHYHGWSWPAFNVADSAVFIGAVLLCIDSLFHKPVPSPQANTNPMTNS